MKKTLVILFVVSAINFKTLALNRYAVITGSVAEIANGDSVTLLVNKYGYCFSEPLLGFKTYKAGIVNHRFYFKIPAGPAPLYAELRFGSAHQADPLTGYLVENGDHISINEDRNHFSFKGTGKEKFEVIYRLSKIAEDDFAGIGEDRGHPDGMLNICKKTDLAGTHQLQYLNANKRILSKAAFILIKAQILGLIYGNASTLYYWDDSSLKDSLKNTALAAIRSYQRSLPAELMDDKVFNTHEFLGYSGTYSCSLILKYKLDSCYLPNKAFVIGNCYTFIKKSYSGALRERTLTNLLYAYRRSPTQDISNWIADALTFFKNEDFRSLLGKLQDLNIKGSIAYNFKLADTLGIIHQLQEYKGKVVLLDFWYTGCGNCIKVAPFLAGIEKSFGGRPVVFLSINVDKDRKVWFSGIKSGKYNSGTATNLFTGTGGFQSAICRHYSINACPTLLLIDKQGALMRNPVDPRIDNRQNLHELIEKELNR